MCTERQAPHVQCGAVLSRVLKPARIEHVVLGTLSCFGCLSAPKPWTLDALMNLRTVSDPQITADGSRVAYVVRQVDHAANRYASTIWVVAASGGYSYQP